MFCLLLKHTLKIQKVWAASGLKVPCGVRSPFWDYLRAGCYSWGKIWGRNTWMLDTAVRKSRLEALISCKCVPKMTLQGEEKASQAQFLVGAEQPLDFPLHSGFFFFNSFLSVTIHSGSNPSSCPREGCPRSNTLASFGSVKTRGPQAKHLSWRPSKLFGFPMPKMRDGFLSVMPCLGGKGFGTQDS